MNSLIQKIKLYLIYTLKYELIGVFFIYFYEIYSIYHDK